MLERPLERAGVPRPRPLSVMSRVISPSLSAREMLTAVAWAWRAQLDSARHLTRRISAFG